MNTIQLSIFCHHGHQDKPSKSYNTISRRCIIHLPLLTSKQVTDFTKVVTDLHVYCTLNEAFANTLLKTSAMIKFPQQVVISFISYTLFPCVTICK